jgi:hypothetical protein
MNLADLTARVHRLDVLMRGLARELALWKKGNDPLLYAERRAYLKAIQDALAGVEEARVVLARANQRLEEAIPRGLRTRPSGADLHGKRKRE